MSWKVSAPVSMKDAVLSCPGLPLGMMIFFSWPLRVQWAENFAYWPISEITSLEETQFAWASMALPGPLVMSMTALHGSRRAWHLGSTQNNSEEAFMLQSSRRVTRSHHWGCVAAWVLLLSSSASFPSADYARPPPKRASSILKSSESALQRTQPVILTNHTFHNHRCFFSHHKDNGGYGWKVGRRETETIKKDSWGNRWTYCCILWEAFVLFCFICWVVCLRHFCSAF